MMFRTHDGGAGPHDRAVALLEGAAAPPGDAKAVAEAPAPASSPRSVVEG